MNILLLSHMKIHGANALSSPISAGVPAISGFLGFVHNLQRHICAIGDYEAIRFSQTAIVLHSAYLKGYRNGMKFAFALTKNLDVDKSANSAKTPRILEEPKVNLDVSLAIRVEHLDDVTEDTQDKKTFSQKAKEIAQCLRLAGGDVVSIDGKPEGWTTKKVEGDDAVSTFSVSDEESSRRFIARLIPGYALIDRHDLLKKEMEEGHPILQSFIEGCAIHAVPVVEGTRLIYHCHRKYPGWIVPISTGFQALGSPAKALNQRDPDCMHVFAENIVTLGEFKFVSAFADDIKKMFWRYSYIPEHGLYVCVNNT